MKDEEIIALYFARDDTAIAETAAKYGSYLTSIALRILHSADDSEEVVNDTYHGAWRTIPPNRPDVLRLFLARIARNIAIDRLEYKLAQKRNADKDVLLSEVAEFLPAQNDVEQLWEARELGAMINCFLSELDTRSRIIFVKRYFHACTVREIAHQLGLSESLVKNALFRTRKKLRTYLEKEGVAI